MRSSALVDNAVYQFGDFTPAADNPSGIDSDGLAGASIYDTTFGPGAQVVDGQTTYELNNLNAMLADGNQIEITTVPGEFTNFLEVTANGTADWIENAGSTTPSLVWDSVANRSSPLSFSTLPTICPLTHGFRISTACSPPGLT